MLSTLIDSLLSSLLPLSPIIHSDLAAEKTPILHRRLKIFALDP
jgi:hypothetical protein